MQLLIISKPQLTHLAYCMYNAYNLATAKKKFLND